MPCGCQRFGAATFTSTAAQQCAADLLSRCESSAVRRLLPRRIQTTWGPSLLTLRRRARSSSLAHQHAARSNGFAPDLGVGPRHAAGVADVIGGVAALSQPVRERRRKVGVDQKPRSRRYQLPPADWG
jgi:hypothetical protein